jgi:hypothetical protein
MDINGLILESKYPQYQHLIKGPFQKSWRDGFPVDEQKILNLQFDRYICFIDDMAREQEWTDTDKEFVAKQVEWQLQDPMFRDMWVHEPAKPPVPWPNYNETHPKQVHTVAQATGLVAEALHYEQNGRAGGPRPDVVKNLTALLADQPDAHSDPGPSIEDELVADF